jgi:uncharacterized protein (TIGR00369 family)
MTFDPATDGWELEPERTNYSDLSGPIWRKVEADGRTVWGLQTDERHRNKFGVVHGGFLMTFADQCLGNLALAAWPGKPCVTLELSHQFVSTAKLGDWVEIRGEVVRQARSVIFLRGLISVGERTVLSSTGIWKAVGG